MREQVVKFEKFIQENDAKRIRAEAKAKQVGRKYMIPPLEPCCKFDGLCYYSYFKSTDAGGVLHMAAGQGWDQPSMFGEERRMPQPLVQYVPLK